MSKTIATVLGAVWSLAGRVLPGSVVRVVERVAARVLREKVALRAAIAAVLSYLVLSGVLDTGASETVEHVVLYVLDALAVISARQAVVPADEIAPVNAPAEIGGQPFVGVAHSK